MLAQPAHTSSRPIAAQPGPPFALLVFPLRQATQGAKVSFAMASAGPEGSLMLIVTYDATRITREGVDAIIAATHGVPTATFEAAPAPACLHGNSFCTGGEVEHDPCESPLLAVSVPGFTSPVTTLDAQIADYGRGPVISFAGDSHDAVEVSAEQLRTVVADVRAHLGRLLALADQFDALTAADPVTTPVSDTGSADG